MADSVTSPTRAALAQQAAAAKALRLGQLGAWRDNPASKPYAHLIDQTSAKTGVPAELLGALLERESQFDPRAHSEAGAVGLAQLMPVHHKRVNPLDPAASALYASQYLRSLHDRTGDWDQALAGYNYGPTNVAKLVRERGPGWRDALPSETRAYVNALGGI